MWIDRLVTIASRHDNFQRGFKKFLLWQAV